MFWLCVCIVLIVCGAVHAEKARDYNAPEGAESVSKAYERETSIMCGGKKIAIPAYFPSFGKSTKQGFYLATDCLDTNIHAYLGLSLGCRGEHVCSYASYLSEKISDDARNIMRIGLEVIAKKIEFGEGSTGYFISAKCGAYCSDSKFVWFSEERIYIISTKDPNDTPENIAELKKSAESLAVKNK